MHSSNYTCQKIYSSNFIHAKKYIFIKFYTCHLSGIELKVYDEICGGGDIIDVDHSSTVSEVFQAEQIEDRGIVDQRQAKYVTPLFLLCYN